MKILAIDPGTTHSAYVGLCDTVPVDFGFLPNNQLLLDLRDSGHEYDEIAVEMIACYGMAVGREVFETCLIIGRIQEIASASRDGAVPCRLITRKDVKLHLCQSPRAKDANIRQALIDRYGGKTLAIGSKAQRGPLYGVKSHGWAALAVAVYAHDNPR